MTTGGLYTLSRKEGWRRYVDQPARTRPDVLTVRQIAALSPTQREDYDEARHDWHANFGILKTAQLATLHDELGQIVATNRQDPDRVRGAAVIDALPGLGKTTIANTFARDLDRRQVRRLGMLTDDGHERLPVFRVGLTSRTTLRTLNRMICDFYGHPGTERANAAQLASYAVDCVLSCQTRIGIIDFTDRWESRPCRPFGPVTWACRARLPTGSGTSVVFRRRCGGTSGAASGGRGSAGSADRPEGRAAVVDDRVARGHGSRGGRSVPAPA
jgi:AAA domain